MARAAQRNLRPVAGVLRTILVAAVTTGALVVATGGAAHADPSPGEIESQIDQKWNKLEPLLEKWNGVHQKLVDNQKKVKKLEKKIKPLKAKVEKAVDRVSTMAVRYYEFGPATKLNALLLSGSPTTFVKQLNMLNEVARSETSEVASVNKLRAKYERQEQPIADLVASLSAQQKKLSKEKKDLRSQLDELQKMRLAAYGDTSGTGSLRPVACPQVYTGDAGSRAAKFACQQIGKPYVWAADGPDSYDCSGLTMAAWDSVGVSLPHNAYQQKQVTDRVSRSDLKPGDLVFYYSDVHHVVMYVGNGWVVSAPTTGEDVQMQHLDTSRVNSYGRP